MNFEMDVYQKSVKITYTYLPSARCKLSFAVANSQENIADTGEFRFMQSRVSKHPRIELCFEIEGRPGGDIVETKIQCGLAHFERVVDKVAEAKAVLEVIEASREEG
jgi:hypothetical protein